MFSATAQRTSIDLSVGAGLVHVRLRRVRLSTRDGLGEDLLELGRGQVLRERDVGLDLQRPDEALQTLLTILEPRDVHGPEVDVGAGRDRVTLEAGLLRRREGV